MGRGDDDDFEDDDDFSLDDGTEDDNDGSASEASVADDGDDDDDDDDLVAEEDGDEGGWSGKEDDESDFEGSKPKAKKAKTTTAPASKGKKASPAAEAKPAKAAPVAKKSPTAAAAKSANIASSSPKPSAAAAKAAAEKPAALIKGEPTTYVLDYMRKTNRPYSLLNVFENLHRAIAKPALTKILDNLGDKGELASKTYGKAKIYYMNQDKLPLPSEQERHDVENQIKQMDADCAALDQEVKAAEGALSSVSSQISDADLEKLLTQLDEEAATLESKLASLERSDRPPIPPGKKDALKRKFTTLRTAWVARKRIVTEAVNQIADGMEKKTKEVYNLVGLETDAEAGVKEIPSI